MALASLSAHESVFRAKLWCKSRWKPAHRFRPFSAAPRRQDFSIHGVTVSFGLGTSPTQRLATQRRTSTTPIRPTDVCFPILLDYEHPYSLVPGASLGLTPKAERQALGTHRVTGGGERSRRPAFLRFGVPRPPLWGVSIARGVLFLVRPTRPTSDALCRASGSGFRRALSTLSRGPSRAGVAKDRSFTIP